MVSIGLFWPRASAESESPARPVPILDALGGMYLADPTRDAGPQQDDDDRLVLRFLSEFVDPGTPVPRQPRPLSIGRGLALARNLSRV